MLDVGQGDSLLFETPAGKYVLVDAGQRKTEVADTLKRLGVDTLDLVIATHAHADHIGGMRAVLESVNVLQYVDSGVPHTTRTYRDLMGVVKNMSVPYQGARAGQVFEFDDGITMKVLWPGGTHLKGTRSDLNSNSVVLRIDHGEDCMLLTGDAERVTEEMLVRHNLQPCDVLKVPHHGSRYSSSLPFLEALQPEIALVSVGAGNRHKHPRPEALARLERVGATLYRTDYTGHVTVVSSGHGFQVVDGLPAGAPRKAVVPMVAVEAAGEPAISDSSAAEVQEEAAVPEETSRRGRLGRWIERLTTR
jgi:beta-lactamase superfamily II metal-dependent hydrolase